MEPGRPTPLVGRDEELASLTVAIRGDRPVAVVGEAGIGKTTLVRTAAARAGRRLHEGGGFATLAWLPYLALRRAVPIAESDDPEAVAEAVRRAVGPDVLFIDDLQWADAASRRVLELLLGTMSLVVAVRAGDPGTEGALALLDDSRPSLIRLVGLDDAAVGAILARLLPSAGNAARQRLLEAAHGNPLVLEELAVRDEPPTWLARAIAKRVAERPPRAAAAADPHEVRDHVRAGRLAAAVDEAERLLAADLDPAARGRVLAWHALALALLGHPEKADTALAEAHHISAAAPQVAGTVLCCRAEVAMWSGLAKRAVALADDASSAELDPDDRVRTMLVRAWAEADLERAVAPAAATSDLAAATELRAIDSLRRAEFVGAATGFEQAAAHWAGRDRLHELACRWGAGEAMRQAGDLDRAVRLLRATLEAATEIGFEPLAARIRRSLRLAGERSASVVGRRVAAGALTGREREVLDLVERGRTNAEIARRMGLGRPTVARLLSNAMTKLGAESRTQAVVLAASVRR